MTRDKAVSRGRHDQRKVLCQLASAQFGQAAFLPCDQRINLRLRGRVHATARFAQRRIRNRAALGQGILPDRKTRAGLTLIPDKRQVGVKDILGAFHIARRTSAIRFAGTFMSGTVSGGTSTPLIVIELPG